MTERTNEDWLRSLGGTGAADEVAVAELREVLRRGLRRALTGRAAADDGFIEDMTQEGVLKVLGGLTTFRGDSRFTTWAYKFVVLEVAGKVARHFWRDPGVPMEGEQWERLPDRFGLDPARESEWRDLLAALRQAVQDTLTEHQRRVFVALVLTGVPLDVLAAELCTNRNAIYKTMFDARRKLRAALAAKGYVDDTMVRRP